MARRTDAWIALALGLVSFATRWPQRGRSLFSWDSGLLASGIVEYDFAASHPHPPFYPLAIALGKVVAVWTGPMEAFNVLSVLASGVMAAFAYLAARGFLERAPAALAAALLILSPTALFNGVAGLTYALEGASSAVVAWAAWRCRAEPSRRTVAVLAVATSIAIGIRPSSVFVVAPLAVWAVWRSPRAMVRGIAVGAVATLAWAIPAAVAGGGVGWFLRATSYQSRHAIFANTVFQRGLDVVPGYAERFASYVAFELPFAAAVAVAALVTAFVWWPHRAPAPARSFMAAWTLPSIAFYLFIYDGWPVYPSGYVLALLPAAAVTIAAAVRAIALGFVRSGAPRPAQTAGVLACALLLVMPMGWTLHWDEAVSGQREADDWVKILPTLRDTYPANETAILTHYAWFWVRFHLPEYLMWGGQPYWSEQTGGILVQVAERRDGVESPPLFANALDGPDDPLHPIPPWVKNVVVVFGPPTRGFADPFKEGSPTQDVTLPSGLRVLVLDAAAAGQPTIEHTLLWFDDEGRPLVAG